MSKKKQAHSKKRVLTKEAILSTSEKSRRITLPSGAPVLVNYLAFFLVVKLLEEVEKTPADNKERQFAEKVVRWMLRDNDRKELSSFSPEDQTRLIELAAEEWGCKDEYDTVTEELVPEQRFYRAVQKQEEELSKQLSETLQKLTYKISAPLFSITPWQESIVSSLQVLSEQFEITKRLGGMIDNINSQAINQLSEIGALSLPISDLIGDLAEITEPFTELYKRNILASVSDVITSYQDLMKDVLPFEKFSILPDAVRYYPTIEMHNTSVIVDNLLMDREEPEREIVTPANADELSEWLTSLDPSFAHMLEGAAQTIFSANPDRCRHFASSHRELFTHLLHLLAPDNAINEWTDDPKLFDKGKPTRKARLLFIARDNQNTSFVNFFVKNILSQIELLNAGEHQKSQEYTEKQMSLLHENFLGTLSFLMEIVKG